MVTSATSPVTWLSGTAATERPLAICISAPALTVAPEADASAAESCKTRAPAVTVAPYFQSAVYASLLPRLDMLKSLGLVWIPGVMAGMMVSGASPIYAGIYQFVIVAMILVASAIAGLEMLP